MQNPTIDPQTALLRRRRYSGACRGGPTLALSDVANGVEAECVVCRMIVRADQVEHPVLGFKARCEGK